MKCVSTLVRWCVSAAAGMSLTGAALAVDYPIITVETDEGTLEAPVRLDDLSVSYVADAETAAATRTFASLGKPTAGTFRKRGSGFVMSSFNMTNFTGTVLIEEGAMCCEGPGSFGPANKTAGAMVISNGASLVVAGHKETMTAYHMEIWNPITAEGTGVNGIGAIYNKTIDVTSRETIKGGLTLAGDTMVGSISASELGDVSGHPYYLNGHTLTLSGGNGMLMNGAQIQSGHIVLTNNSVLRVQSGFKLDGGATNVLKVCKGAKFAFYNGANFTAPWTLVFEDCLVNPSGSNATNTIVKLGRHQWVGPIQVKGTTSIDGANNEGFSLLGPVTGSGGFNLVRGYLNLTNDLNDFRGPVTIKPTAIARQATLGLWSSNAWPQANAYPLVATNGTVYFGKKVNYNLPQIIWHNASSYTNSYMYGTATYLTTPGLVKTGDGEVAIPGQLNATNRTELRAGTLRLAPSVTTQYSLHPGIWESVTKFGTNALPSSVMTAYYDDGTKADTNGVQSALRYCQKTGKNTYPIEPSWDDGTETRKNGGDQVSRYEGYIWNRSSVTQRWSLAMASIRGKLYIDDALVLKQHNTWYWLATNTISVAPGPHKFDIRFWNSGYGTGGAKPAYRIANGLTGEKMYIKDPDTGESVLEPLPETWPNNFGFGIDVQGRSSLYSKDYVKPTNGVGAVGYDDFAAGGDGMLFTRTTNSVEQGIADGSFAAAHLRSSFDTLAAWDGTTLDLGGGDVYVRQLEGFTHATNGTLHVAGTWTLDSAAVKDGAKLTVDNAAKIVFGAGAVIAADEPFGPDLRGRTLTLISADSADSIVGTPSFNQESFGKGASVTFKNGTVSVFVPKRPTAIIVR